MQQSRKYVFKKIYERRLRIFFIKTEKCVVYSLFYVYTLIAINIRRVGDNWSNKSSVQKIFEYLKGVEDIVILFGKIEIC